MKKETESLDNYPKPSVTVDCVIFGYYDNQISVLLLNRKEEPFANTWTLPGGFLRMDETFEQAAKRVLSDKTGLNEVFLEQLYSFDTPNRDPRGRVLSIAYYALVNPTKFNIVAGSAANDVQWFPWTQCPNLGFDHADILQIAINRLKNKILWQPIGFELLDAQFTMTELQTLYETIEETPEPYDRRNFYKRIMEFDILNKVGTRQNGGKGRSADLFEFDKNKYNILINKGLSFKI
jgi:8-oxo-dGTP diphosphatase